MTEEVFHQDTDVLVSSSRFVIGAKTFAMASVVSFRGIERDPRLIDISRFIGAAFALPLISIFVEFNPFFSSRLRFPRYSLSGLIVNERKGNLITP